jgi:tetratricopeptide (TPR) repeat protein
MSSKEDEAADAVMCCASCGIAAVDNVKLKNCACGLVKYCSDACQKDHRSKHKKLCKKRLAENRDRDLFTQPDSSHWGECPVCCLPLPLDPRKSCMARCCCKMICRGCNYAHQMREIEQGRHPKCAYCREPVPETVEEGQKSVMKRVKKNDPAALCDVGIMHHNEGDYQAALEYFTKAADLGDAGSWGDAGAHFELSNMYYEGHGVEKDKKKELYHLEEAAMRGHAWARNNLGCFEWENGRFERAVKHWIIAANLGHQNSLKGLKDSFIRGLISKDDYATALRTYQAVVDEMKSLQREEAEACFEAKGTEEIRRS